MTINTILFIIIILIQCFIMFSLEKEIARLYKHVFELYGQIQELADILLDVTRRQKDGFK